MAKPLEDFKKGWRSIFPKQKGTLMEKVGRNIALFFKNDEKQEKEIREEIERQKKAEWNYFTGKYEK